MELTGTIQGIEQDYTDGRFKVTFNIGKPSITSINALNSLIDERLSIKATKYRERRSKDANGLLWHCLGKIAETLRADKWDIYLQMLKRYGKYTYICVKPKAVDAVKAQWRECEEIGEIDINGQKSIQMLCYFGSSTYDTKEFSTLLEGVISEMQELGLETPTSEEMRESLKQWERKLSHS